MKIHLFATSLIVAAFLFFSHPALAAVPFGDLLAGVVAGPDGMIDVVSFTAHPDDEAIYAGGTLIKMKTDPRVRLHVVCLTNGDASDARLFMAKSAEEMARIRAGEYQAAGRALGADDIIQLPYHDQGLKPADPVRLVDEIVAIMERTGAEVVITHDPGGITGHPDHVTCSRAVTAAFARSQAQRLYYATMSKPRYLAAWTLSPIREPSRPAWPTLAVDIHAERDQKRKAIMAHESQMKHSLVGLDLPLFYWNNTEWFASGGSK
jgi:N-acetylglucosamine malate deacetylase 2